VMKLSEGGDYPDEGDDDGGRKSTCLYTFSKVAMVGAKAAPLIKENKRVA
jgi:hypothetical protein